MLAFAKYELVLPLNPLPNFVVNLSLRSIFARRSGLSIDDFSYETLE